MDGSKADIQLVSLIKSFLKQIIIFLFFSLFLLFRMQQMEANRFKRTIHQFWDNRIHFLELHYLYIFVLIFIMSGLYYCEPDTNWAYIDALFMATTGITDTGLNTIAMSDMSTYHMILLFLSSFLGCHVIISFYVVMVRRYYFSKRFEEELKENQRRKEEYKQQKLLREQEQQQRALSDSSSTLSKSAKVFTGPIRRRLSLVSIRSTPPQSSKKYSIFGRKRGSFDTSATRTEDIVVQHPNYNYQQDEEAAVESVEDDAGTHPCDNSRPPSNRNSVDISSYNQQTQDTTLNPINSIQNTNNSNNNNNNSNNQQITFREDTNVLRERERRKLLQNREEFEQLPLQRTNSEYEIMRQPSAKSDLTKNERYRIGGTEYRALEMLARIVPMYYLGFVIIFAFAFRIYIAASSYAQEVLATSNPTGPVDPWFFSFFQSLSGFTNLGLNHLDASMTPFQNAPAPLILSIILILVGNTAFAIVLRFIIWACYKLTPEQNFMRRETFRYLLDHPRRCYTTLFPATQTWWLLIVLVAITLTELVCFLALNYWLPVLADISWGSRFLDGLFQSVATRNGNHFFVFQKKKSTCLDINF
jgi:Trk-type K+ transport system membrane component